MAVRNGKKSLNISLDTRVIDLIDAAIKALNEQGKKDPNFDKVTRSKFIQTIVLNFLVDSTDDTNEDKGEN